MSFALREGQKIAQPHPFPGEIWDLFIKGPICQPLLCPHQIRQESGGKALEIELAKTDAKASQPTVGLLFCLVSDFTGSLAQEQAQLLHACVKGHLRSHELEA